MTESVVLREVAETDLPEFFRHQLDPEAGRMAAFMAKDPADRDAFMAHWAKIMADKTITIRTIEHDGGVAGHIASFLRDGTPEVTYWIDPKLWGRGIATAALEQFLLIVPSRPLFARTASDNRGSIRVLEKCGFRQTATETGYANAREAEIEEGVFELV